MILIVTLCFLFASLLTFFVLSPLFKLTNKEILFQPSQLNEKIKNLLLTKEQLMARLTQPDFEYNPFKDISEAEARVFLYDTCEKLDDMGIDWHSSHSFQKTEQQGFVRTHFIAVLLVLFAAYFIAQPLYVHAQQENPLPANVTIPPPIILPGSGYWLPSVNQFILLPEQGVLHVYYVGMFSNTFHAAGTQILLPFPSNIQKMQVRFLQDTQLVHGPQKENTQLILNTSLSPGVNQVQAEFDVSAAFGIAHWQTNALTQLPGVSIFIIPQGASTLLDAFPELLARLNIWPPRVIDMPPDFKSFLSADVLKGSVLGKGHGGELSKQFIRVGNEQASYPEFQVVGIVPNRIFIHGIVIFFASLFLAAVLFILYKVRSSTSHGK